MSIYDRVLITGGGGMLAHALAKCLRSRGVEPIVKSRADADITNLAQLDAIIRSGATLFLNTAAYTKVDLAEQEKERAYEVNGYAIGELANACRLAEKKLVHFSTDFVFDGGSTVPYRPEDQTNPASVYGQSKLGGESAALDHLKYGGDILIIRTSWLYGPNGPNFVQTMLSASRAGKPLTVVDDQIGSPTFTHDLAEATLDLIDRGAKGIYHATNSGQTSWFEFAKAIFEEFQISNFDLKPISSAKWKEMRPTSAIRPAYSVLDCSATEKLIGRKMPDWREALHRYRIETENPKSEIRNPKQ